MKVDLIRTCILIMVMTALSLTARAARPNAVAGEDMILMDASGAATVQLDASESTDDGTIQAYYWVLNDTDTISMAVQFSFEAVAAESKLTLKVVDDEGETDQDIMYVFVGHPTNHGNHRIGIRNGEQQIFTSGMNIAWNSFARDLNGFDASDALYFETIMDSISLNGGNALRWWLHTNGSASPQFDEEGNVTAIDFANIEAMKQVLDMAFDRGLVISMCLWSFDMLQNQGQNRQFTRGLLEDPNKTQTYIDHALIPILDQLGDHPAVMTWEVFNEPEGMVNQSGLGAGWAHETTTFPHIQRFINQVAGAIHRAVPGALVSNGSWSFRASTDIGGFKNYYSDEELIAAGGDEDGYLDFYQIHYYAEHFGNNLSPFHRPASHWGLDKPIVIGEFRSAGIFGMADPHLSTEEAYRRAIELGYAGALSWSWTDSPVSEFTETMGQALKGVANDYPDDLIIDNSAIDLERIPMVTSVVEPIRQLLSQEDIVHLIDLTEVFYDEEDGTELIFEVKELIGESLISANLDAEGILQLTLLAGQIGEAYVTVKATDSDGWSVSLDIQVYIGDGAAHESNLAYYTSVWASSIDNSDHLPIYINDGSITTRWSSTYANDQWVTLDLGSEQVFNYINILWETAYGSEYELQASDDNENWETIFLETSGDGGTDIIIWDEPVTGRYLRMYGLERGTQWGFSIYEMVVKHVDDNQSPQLINSIADVEINWSDTDLWEGSIDLDEVFFDEEDNDFLTYRVASSNSEIAELSLDTRRNRLDYELTGNPGHTDVTITVTDPFGDEAETSFSITMNDDQIMDIRSERGSFRIFPNPADSSLAFEAEGGNLISVKVFSLSGQELMAYHDIGPRGSIDISELARGIYQLEIKSKEKTETYKFVKSVTP